MTRCVWASILLLALVGGAVGEEEGPVLVRATLRSATDGKPLVHFPLRVVSSKLQPGGRDLELETDAGGRIALPVSTSTTIESRKAGWSLGVVCVPALLKRPELVAWPVGEVEVRLDWRGKGPAPDWPKAKVGLKPVWSGPTRLRSQQLGFVAAPARPNEAGVCRRRMPLVGRVSVRVEATDAKRVRQVFDLASLTDARAVEVPVEPREAIWIHGRVLAPLGEPVDGATLWVTVPGRAPRWRDRRLSIRQRGAVPRLLLPGVENDVGGGDGLPSAARWARSGYATTTRRGGRFAVGIDEPSQDVHLVAYVEGHAPVRTRRRVVRAEAEGFELRLGPAVEPVRFTVKGLPDVEGTHRLAVQELSQIGAGPRWSIPLDGNRIAVTSWLVDGRTYRFGSSHPVDVLWRGQDEITLRPR